MRSAWTGLPSIRNLRVWHKQMLAGLILLLPFVLGTAWTVRQTYQESMHGIDREVAATQVLLHLQQLLNDLQAVRVTSVALASGDNQLANEVGEQELKTIQTDVATITTQDAAIQQTLGTASTWASLGELVTATLNASERMHAAESVTRYEQVTTKVEELLLTTADQSLGPDPQVEVSNCLQLMTDAQDAVRRIGLSSELVASRGALRQNLNADDTTELIRLMSLLDRDETSADLVYKRALTRNPALHAHLDEGYNAFKSACDDFNGYLQNGVLANGGDLPRAVHGHTVTALTGVGKLMTAFGPTLTWLLQSRQDANRQAMQTHLMVSGAALLVACLLAFVIVGDGVRPLQEVSKVITAIAQGDFSRAVPRVARGDEYGAINSALGTMASQVQTILQGLRDAVTTQTEATVQIMRLTREQVAATGQMVVSIAEASASVEEVRDGVQQVVQKVEAATRAAEEVGGASQASVQAADRSMREVQKVCESTHTVVETLRRVNEQSKALTEIVESLNRLAEQANKVAYNASVEASKSGEGGYGTALVAQETRRLTEQSQQATTRIKAIVGDVQNAMAAAVMLTDQALKAGQEGLRQATETSRAISGLGDKVSAAGQAVAQVNGAARQQFEAAERASSAVTTIRGSSANAEQGSQALQSQAQRLYQISQQMKTQTES